MSRLVLMAGAAIGLISAVEAGDRAVAAQTSSCSTRTPGGDELTVDCVLPESTSVQRYVFTARFSGGHDDTEASLSPTLGDVPLPCTEASKLSLFGEEGEVSLFCRFAIAPDGDAVRRLRVRVRWSHAQYSDFSLIGE